MDSKTRYKGIGDENRESKEIAMSVENEFEGGD